MPTKVLDLDFADLPAAVDGLGGYARTLVLLRFKGLPVGSLHIPIAGPRLTGQQVREAACQKLGFALANAWLSDWIGYDGRPDPQPLPSATVAVCTRDRTQDLARCLQSLVTLMPNGQPVLVVDSCSKDDTTRQVAARFPAVRYVREERPGLDRARNRALREADTEIVAFIDDDAIPGPGWLHALLRNFDNSEVMCVTGLTMPVELETDSQEAFEQAYPFARGFRRVVYDRWILPPVQAGRVGVGANMALRRSVLEAVGPFDEALDAGTQAQSSGDTDMFAQILSRGYLAVYDPAAINWHRHRRTWEELLAQAYAYGAGPYAEFAALWLRERDPAVFFVALNWLLLDQLPRLMKGLLRRPGCTPPRLTLAELRGCTAGVRGYLAERRRQGDGQTVAGSTNGRSAITLLTPTAPIATTSEPLPTVSVIIPSYNRSASLRQAVLSLCQQDYPLDQAEVVVVLDGSQDDSAAMLTGLQLPFRLRVIEQTNQGISAARNNGAAHATGEVLIFMDDDMEASPSHLSGHARPHLGRNDRLVVGYFEADMGGLTTYFADQLRAWWGAAFKLMNAAGHRYAYTDMLGGNCSMPKHLFDQVGDFYVPLLRHMDYELGLRVLAAGGEIAFARGGSNSPP